MSVVFRIGLHRKSFLLSKGLIHQQVFTLIKRNIPAVSESKCEAMALTEGIISGDLFQELGYYGNDATLCLTMGAPGRQTLTKCREILQTATQHRLEKEAENGYLFQYGARLGDWHYRKNLAEFLTQHYCAKVDLKNLMLTCGASHGLYMAASLLFRKGGIVFIEDPTYFIALSVLKDDLHMELKTVPLDEDGMDEEILQNELKKLPVQDDTNHYRAMLYLIPAYQNPTGICYSEKRCKQIIDLAEKYDVLVVCDDVYNLLHYRSTPPPKPLFFSECLASDDEKGHVISNGTFSKILAPGIRLGWIQTSPYILKLFYKSGVLRSGGNFNNYISGIMSSALEMGLQTEHLKGLLGQYSGQMTMVGDILKKQLPPGCTVNEPQGGYFFWITLPSDFNAEKFSEWLKEKHQVAVHPGNRCSALGNFSNCIRIAITFLETSELQTAIQKFCKGLNDYMKLL